MNGEMELNGKKMNVIGDSITQGVGTSCIENIYMNIVAKRCNLAEVRNYGISGTKIAHHDEDNGNSFVDRFDKMDNDADIIVVFGGTNDYGRGHILPGTADDRTPDTFYGACHILFEGLIKKYPLSEIIVMTPVQRSIGADPDPVRNGLPEITLLDFVNVLKEVATFYAIPVLDLYAVSGIHPQIECNRINYCPDGLHPNDRGHAIIASRLESFLKNL